jgi:hypothetical protein
VDARRASGGPCSGSRPVFSRASGEGKNLVDDMDAFLKSDVKATQDLLKDLASKEGIDIKVIIEYADGGDEFNDLMKLDLATTPPVSKFEITKNSFTHP